MILDHGGIEMDTENIISNAENIQGSRFEMLSF